MVPKWGVEEKSVAGEKREIWKGEKSRVQRGGTSAEKNLSETHRVEGKARDMHALEEGKHALLDKVEMGGFPARAGNKRAAKSEKRKSQK